MTRSTSSVPPLADLARELSSGERDAEALTEQHLARHRPELHAYRRFDPELARRAAARAQARLKAGHAGLKLTAGRWSTEGMTLENALGSLAARSGAPPRIGVGG